MSKLEKVDDNREGILNNSVLNIVVGALLGSIPGVLLWLLMAKLNFLSGIIGFFIIMGMFIGYRYFAKEVDKIGIVICTVLAVVIVAMLDIGVTAYELHQKYEVECSDDKIKKEREKLIEDTKSNSSGVEISKFLSENTNAESLDDEKELDKSFKNWFNESFLEAYGIKTIPDTTTNSLKAEKDMLIHNRTTHLAKMFLANITTGIAFCFLGLVVSLSYKPFWNFTSEEDDE